MGLLKQDQELDISLSHEDVVLAAFATIDKKSAWAFTEFTPHQTDTRFDVMACTHFQKDVRVIECKATRSDWNQDAKWSKYQKYCHHLFFCAPKGIIRGDELPAGAGLIEVTVKGKRQISERKGESAAMAQRRLSAEPWKVTLESRIVRMAARHREVIDTDEWIAVLGGMAFRRKLDYDKLMSAMNGFLTSRGNSIQSDPAFTLLADRIPDWLE